MKTRVEQTVANVGGKRQKCTRPTRRRLSRVESAFADAHHVSATPLLRQPASTTDYTGTSRRYTFSDALFGTTITPFTINNCSSTNIRQVTEWLGDEYSGNVGSVEERWR